MKAKIKQLFTEIEQKKNELLKEYETYKKEYHFEILKDKIIFPENIKKIHKKIKVSVPQSVLGATIRTIISIPFIYMMILPAIILDIFLWCYQQTALRLYSIPLVKRSDYIVYNRQHLEYLNALEKLNCIYCSYFNGLMGYAVEVAGRTEAYWCPIKHAKKNNTWHAWQKDFADYGDAKGFRKQYNRTDCFKKIKHPGERNK
ncbi:hypothetical protein MK079_02905 [Candidatus Gracilibacteria bacterium]|nr:hypothetical protein [Candidatus Gracilibacteria bacterium]